MFKTPERQSPTPLFRAALQEDGTHTSKALVQDMAQGSKLRVRHGIYVETAEWTEAPPWHRYRIAVAATAMRDPALIFCRESALTLHGVPLLHVPQKVMVRTTEPGWAGTKQPPRMLGARNIPTKHIEPALWSGIRRGTLRDRIKASEYDAPQVQLPPEALSEVSGAPGYRAEPLGLVLVDTVSRMAFAEAVLVLDGARAREELDLSDWLPFLTSQRRRLRWDRAWEFSDARSESPGESLSRALIYELGLPAPTLQRRICTDSGDFRVDFCWEDERIIGEFDGRMKYIDDQMLAGQDVREVLYREKLREDALRRAGWHVVRWGWDQLKSPRELAARLRQAGLSRSPAAP